MLRLVAVHPDFQDRGIGQTLVAAGYDRSSLWLQPASAYMNANEGPKRDHFLQSCGYRQDFAAGGSYKKLYGPDTRDAYQLRYKRGVRNGGARGVAKHIFAAHPEIAKHLKK